jgi:quercetin dioxygenase-like cupin family protein
MKAFSSFGFKTGPIADLDRQFPSYLSAWDDATFRTDDDAATNYGYVHSGYPVLVLENSDGTHHEQRTFNLYPGMYFSVPGRFKLIGSRSQGIVVSREDHKGFFQIGGSVEYEGRLKYIDGCTDSLLMAPIRLGDPCVNLLYFPAGIDQTAHDHPSDRIGMILSGRGQCHYWNGSHEEVIDLVPGMLFCIHAGGLHKFSTLYGEDMRVLAYHPDSDFGPTDENHPMINRTMVDGVSAAKIEAIRTK